MWMNPFITGCGGSLWIGCYSKEVLVILFSSGLATIEMVLNSIWGSPLTWYSSAVIAVVESRVSALWGRTCAWYLCGDVLKGLLSRGISLGFNGSKQFLCSAEMFVKSVP
ncbi:hypothetical protein U1Q18_020726 [Sarracenia purpurea var. burkii]